MAPELILALVDEDEHSSDGSQALDSSGSSKPKITTMSDVYAFGSVCLEVCFLPPNGLVVAGKRVDWPDSTFD